MGEPDQCGEGYLLLKPIHCFFTQSYEQREPVTLTTSHADCRMGAVARDPDQLDVFWVGPTK